MRSTIRNSLLLLLLSPFVHAQMKGDFGMIPVPVMQFVDNAEVTNMPPIVTQDSLGICYAFAAAKLIDRQTCVDQKIDDCKNLPASKRVTPLDIAKFAKTPDNDRSERSSYNGIEESGILDSTLKNVYETGGKLATEECAPFNQVVAENQDPKKREEIEKNFWARLRMLHEQYKKNDPSCSDCQIETATAVDKLRQDFKIKASNQEILKAFAKDTFALSLEKMLIPAECTRFGKFAKIKGNYGVVSFPENPLPHKDKAEFDESYKTMIKKIKSNLSNQIPMGLSFCAQEGELTYKSIGECNPKDGETSSIAGASHAVVISGYRRVCKDKMVSSKDCYDALKVENSWGQDWQQKNNDGWVDAKELMKRTFFAKSSLTWLEKQ